MAAQRMFFRTTVIGIEPSTIRLYSCREIRLSIEYSIGKWKLKPRRKGEDY